MSQALTTATGAGQIVAAARPAQRLEAIDMVRGLVMVLMALDHVRDYLTSARFDPLDLTHTTPAYFLTRWVTHYCAATFVFLAGTGAFLWQARGRTRAQLSWFLLTRGFWLIFLEFTLVHLAWSFNPLAHAMMAQVIWVIGASMVVLGGVVWLPPQVVTVLAVVLIAGHNALDSVRPNELGPFALPWKILMSGGLIVDTPRPTVVMAYPLVPWLGILMLGYGLGPIWRLEQRQRRRRLFHLGLAFTVLFLVLRLSNSYGDPRPWSVQGSVIKNILAPLDCNKYPPSLLYTLMTLGPALMLLAWWDRTPGPVGRHLIVFGRVPLFYYLLHIPLIHGLTVLLAWLRYGDAGFSFEHLLAARPPENFGYDLPVVYLIWAGVVMILYFPCRWFAGVKARHRTAWLSYL